MIRHPLISLPLSGRALTLGLAIAALFGSSTSRSATNEDAASPQFPATEFTTFLNPTDIEQVGDVAFTRCRLSDRQQTNYLHAECGFVEVPEDYAAPEGDTIKLFVVRLPSSAKKPAAAPLVAIDGGPGSAASENLLFGLHRLLDKVRQQRDVYLIDQRGTGKSSALRCPDLPDSMDRSDLGAVLEVARDCLKSLTRDPRLYTTSVAIHDYERARQALNVEQWDIYGISYGTRVAQHYLRRYPDRVRALVLDGVVHPQLNLGIDVALESDRALKQMLARCRKSEDCQRTYPDLEQGIRQLLSKLEPGLELTVENFSSGRKELFRLNREQVTGLIRLSLYSPVSATILPLVLHEAYANDNFAPLARRAMLVERAMDSMSAGMHASVVCTEDVAFTKPAEVDYTSLDRSYMGKEFFETLYELCQIWPQGVRDEDLKLPLRTKTPTLLLSGSSDPITPPAYAEQAAEQLEKHQHIVVQDFGHGVAGVGCMPTLIARFLEDPAALPVESTCLDKLKPDPFFIDFNGPSP